MNKLKTQNIKFKKRGRKMSNNFNLIRETIEQIKNTTKGQLQEAIKLVNKEEREEKQDDRVDSISNNSSMFYNL